MIGLFSPRRLGAMLAKEFVQMRRDRITFAMMLAVPIVQLLLFGYAINNDPRGLPAAILALGQTLRVPLLAEGVETRSQLDILLSEGCDEAQGYFLGRPVPVERIRPGGTASEAA